MGIASNWAKAWSRSVCDGSWPLGPTSVRKASRSNPVIEPRDTSKSYQPDRIHPPAGRPVGGLRTAPIKLVMRAPVQPGMKKSWNSIVPWSSTLTGPHVGSDDPVVRELDRQTPHHLDLTRSPPCLERNLHRPGHAVKREAPRSGGLHGGA